MKNILITGTSSGIGLAATVELAKRGERVFATMRNLDKAGPLQAALAEAGVEASVLQLDVTDDVSVRRAVEQVLAEAGSIDVLVNNAGVAAIGPLEFASDEQMFRVFDTNLFGAHRAIRAVLPSMRSTGSGRIVNVSSPAAHPRLGVRLWSIYTASKAALSALSLDLLKEVGPLGIEVVLLEGGVAGHTPIWEELRTQSEHFAGTAYALSEKVSRGQILATTSGPDPLPRVAAMVADACIVPDPGIRFPPENQVPLDSVDRLPDETFARLARAETNPELYEGVTGLWALQPRLLA